MKKIEMGEELEEIESLGNNMLEAFSKVLGVPKEFLEPHYNPARKVLNNLNNRLMRGINEH